MANLRNAIALTVDAMASVSGKDVLWLSTLNHATPVCTLRSTCWAANVNDALRCRAVGRWDKGTGNWWSANGPTLIGRRHVVWADHLKKNSNGDLARWISADGLICEREIVASARVGLTDAHLGRLNADVDAFVPHARVFPANIDDYFESMIGLPLIAVQHLSGALYAGCHEVAVRIPGGSPVGLQTKNPGVLSTPERNRYWVNPLGGSYCSGSPMLAIVDGLPVLIWCFWGVTVGPFITDYMTAFQNTINGMGDPETLDVIDLSGYDTSFGLDSSSSSSASSSSSKSSASSDSASSASSGSLSVSSNSSQSSSSTSSESGDVQSSQTSPTSSSSVEDQSSLSSSQSSDSKSSSSSENVSSPSSSSSSDSSESSPSSSSSSSKSSSSSYSSSSSSSSETSDSSSSNKSLTSSSSQSSSSI